MNSMNLGLGMWAWLQDASAQGFWQSLLGPIATLTLALVGWIARTVFTMRDTVLKIPDLIKKVDGHDDDIDELRTFRTKIETLSHQYERELEMYGGPERRRIGLMIQDVIDEKFNLHRREGETQ